MEHVIQPVIFEDDLLELDLDFAEKSTYTHNGIPVPRVTHIIRACVDNDKLIEIAGRMPSYKYNATWAPACAIGTEVHSRIDNYVNFLFGKSKVEDLELIDYSLDLDSQCKAENAYTNFKLWYKALNNAGFKFDSLVGLEIPITTPWYGGTIDAIVQINGLYYVIDFKTSSSIRNEYLVQTAAYMWAVNEYHHSVLPHIDGIGIIRVDKNNVPGFQDLFLNTQNQNQLYIINQMQICFSAMIASYYRTNYTDILSSNYTREYRTNKLLTEVLGGK